MSEFFNIEEISRHTPHFHRDAKLFDVKDIIIGCEPQTWAVKPIYPHLVIAVLTLKRFAFLWKL